MEIKDVLHFYIGCDCVDETGRRGWLSGFDVYERDYSITMLTMHYPNSEDDFQVFNDNEELDRIKLVLRPLSDMTEEEAKMIYKFGASYAITNPKHALLGFTRPPFQPIHGINPCGLMMELLSQGFDLFGLIDAGLAIDNKSL